MFSFLKNTKVHIHWCHHPFDRIGTGDKRKKLNATIFESALGFVVTPFQDITSGIGRWVENTTSERREEEEILAENESLREQVASCKQTTPVFLSMKRKTQNFPHC